MPSSYNKNSTRQPACHWRFNGAVALAERAAPPGALVCKTTRGPLPEPDPRNVFRSIWRVQASSTLFTVTSGASVQDHSRHTIDRNNNDSDETLTYLNFENKIVEMRKKMMQFG